MNYNCELEFTLDFFFLFAAQKQNVKQLLSIVVLTTRIALRFKIERPLLLNV